MTVLNESEQHEFDTIRPIVEAMAGRVEGPFRLDDGRPYAEIRLEGWHWGFVWLDEELKTQFAEIQ